MKNTNDFSKCKLGDRLFYLFWNEYSEITKIDDCYIWIRGNGAHNEININNTGFNDCGVQVLFWAEPEIIAPEKPKTKIPFDLQKALENPDSLITRDGRKVIEWKWFENVPNDICRLICNIDNSLYSFYHNGKWSDTKDSSVDLFIEE